MRSTTAVIGMPSSANQAPPHSQLAHMRQRHDHAAPDGLGRPQVFLAPRPEDPAGADFGLAGVRQACAVDPVPPVLDEASATPSPHQVRIGEDAVLAFEGQHPAHMPFVHGQGAAAPPGHGPGHAADHHPGQRFGHVAHGAGQAAYRSGISAVPRQLVPCCRRLPHRRPLLSRAQAQESGPREGRERLRGRWSGRRSRFHDRCRCPVPPDECGADGRRDGAPGGSGPNGCSTHLGGGLASVRRERPCAGSATPPGTAAPSRQVRQRDSTLPSRQATTRRRTATSLPEASFHTLTKRAMAVIEIRTSMAHSTGTTNALSRRAMPSRIIRSARSMRPPLAEKPEGLGLGPLVGDQSGHPEHRQVAARPGGLRAG